MYKVNLSAEPNPDHSLSSHEGTIRIKPHLVEAKSLSEARNKVAGFIEENDLGGGNWTGGEVYKDGKQVAYISANGRVWATSNGRNWDATTKEITGDQLKMEDGGNMASGGSMTAADKETIKEIIRTHSFMDLRKPLEEAGFKVSFNTYDAPMPPAMYRVEKGNTAVGILNEKYVEDAEFTHNGIAMGEMGEGGEMVKGGRLKSALMRDRKYTSEQEHEQAYRPDRVSRVRYYHEEGGEMAKGGEVNMDKHIWEGWTVRSFIEDLEPQFNMIMNNNSWQKPFKTKEQVKKWAMDNQPYYKKYIPDVVNYFWAKVEKYPSYANQMASGGEISEEDKSIINLGVNSYGFVMGQKKEFTNKELAEGIKTTYSIDEPRNKAVYNALMKYPEMRHKVIAEDGGSMATGGEVEVSQKEKMYLDWVNNFVTIEKFAEHYHISEQEANKIIEEGRKEHNLNVSLRKQGSMATGGGVDGYKKIDQNEALKIFESGEPIYLSTDEKNSPKKKVKKNETLIHGKIANTVGDLREVVASFKSDNLPYSKTVNYFKSSGGSMAKGGNVANFKDEGDYLSLKLTKDGKLPEDRMYEVDELEEHTFSSKEEAEKFASDHGWKASIEEYNEFDFERGGRLKSALMRDRKYTSEQEHEQAYRPERVSRVRYYHEEGGEMAKGGQAKGERMIAEVMYRDADNYKSTLTLLIPAGLKVKTGDEINVKKFGLTESEWQNYVSQSMMGDGWDDSKDHYDVEVVSIRKAEKHDMPINEYGEGGEMAKGGQAKGASEYLVAETVSGQGYSEPTFTLFIDFEKAEKFVQKKIKDEFGSSEVTKKGKFDYSIEVAGDGMDDEDVNNHRIQIIPVPAGKNHLIFYYEPNEVEVTSFNTHAEAKKRMEKAIENTEWQDQDEVDEYMEERGDSFGSHAEDSYNHYEIISSKKEMGGLLAGAGIIGLIGAGVYFMNKGKKKHTEKKRRAKRLGVNYRTESGRLRSAIARERKYTSEEEHEQAYRQHRTSRVRYYHEEGGEMTNELSEICSNAVTRAYEYFAKKGLVPTSQDIRYYVASELTESEGMNYGEAMMVAGGSVPSIVKVSVTGGVAYVEKCPKNVDCFIVDIDAINEGDPKEYNGKKYEDSEQLIKDIQSDYKQSGKKYAIVTVRGGVAHDHDSPKGVKVYIQDHDNNDEEMKKGGKVKVDYDYKEIGLIDKPNTAAESILKRYHPPIEVYKNANKHWVNWTTEQRELALAKYVPEFDHYFERKKYKIGTAVPNMNWKNLAWSWQRDIAIGLHNDLVNGKTLEDSANGISKGDFVKVTDKQDPIYGYVGKVEEIEPKIGNARIFTVDAPKGAYRKKNAISVGQIEDVPLKYLEKIDEEMAAGGSVADPLSTAYKSIQRDDDLRVKGHRLDKENAFVEFIDYDNQFGKIRYSDNKYHLDYRNKKSDHKDMKGVRDAMKEIFNSGKMATGGGVSSFNKGDELIIKRSADPSNAGRKATVISYDPNEKQGSAIFKGGMVKVSVEGRQGEFLYTAHDFEKQVHATGGTAVSSQLITKLELVDQPMMQTTQMFSDPQKFIDSINQSKKLIVNTKYETKTSINMTIRSGEMAFKLNNKVEGLKYLVREESNMWSHERYTAYYLKPKSIDDIHRHVEENIKAVLPSVQLEGLTLQVYKTQPVMSIINTGKLEDGGELIETEGRNKLGILTKKKFNSILNWAKDNNQDLYDRLLELQVSMGDNYGKMSGFVEEEMIRYNLPFEWFYSKGEEQFLNSGSPTKADFAALKNPEHPLNKVVREFYTKRFGDPADNPDMFEVWFWRFWEGNERQYMDSQSAEVYEEVMHNHAPAEMRRGGTANPFAVCTVSIGHTAGTQKRSEWTQEDKDRYERCVLNLKDKYGIKKAKGGDLKSLYQKTSDMSPDEIIALYPVYFEGVTITESDVTPAVRRRLAGNIFEELQNCGCHHDENEMAEGGDVSVFRERSFGKGKKTATMLMLQKDGQSKTLNIPADEIKKYNRNEQSDLQKLWGMDQYIMKYENGGTTTLVSGKKMTAKIIPYTYHGYEYSQQRVWVDSANKHPDPIKKMIWGWGEKDSTVSDFKGLFEQDGKPVTIEYVVPKRSTANQEKGIRSQAIQDYVASITGDPDKKGFGGILLGIGLGIAGTIGAQKAMAGDSVEVVSIKEVSASSKPSLPARIRFNHDSDPNKAGDRVYEAYKGGTWSKISRENYDKALMYADGEGGRPEYKRKKKYEGKYIVHYLSGKKMDGYYKGGLMGVALKDGGGLDGIESSLTEGDVYVVGIEYQTPSGNAGQTSMEIVIDDPENFMDEEDVINEAHSRFKKKHEGYKIVGGDVAKKSSGGSTMASGGGVAKYREGDTFQSGKARLTITVVDEKNKRYKVIDNLGDSPYGAWYDFSAMDKFKKLSSGGSMEKGGRLKSALMRDRKYTSEQEHEQAYRKDRVSKVRYYHEKGGDVGVDLFEDYENIPKKVQKILDKYEEGFQDGDYAELRKAKDELESIGYTFDYYLDGVAYDLRKIGQKGKVELATADQDGEAFRKGGSMTGYSEEDKAAIKEHDLNDVFVIVPPDEAKKTYTEKEIFALDLRDGSDFLVTEDHDVDMLIDSGEFAFGIERAMRNGGTVKKKKRKGGNPKGTGSKPIHDWVADLNFDHKTITIRKGVWKIKQKMSDETQEFKWVKKNMKMNFYFDHQDKPVVEIIDNYFSPPKEDRARIGKVTGDVENYLKNK